jgi:hypothetical protein
MDLFTVLLGLVTIGCLSDVLKNNSLLEMGDMMFFDEDFPGPSCKCIWFFSC